MSLLKVCAFRNGEKDKVCLLFGADNDEVVLPDTTITFSSSSFAEHCFTVEIVSDDLVENEDTVMLRLFTANDEIITLSPETTMILITNDDCKILHKYL